MLRKRLIVSLLIDEDCHLVNTINFSKRNYIGDPLNAAYIFSHYEVDELLILDIDASKNRRFIPYEFVKALSNFTTVPLTIGGGIGKIEQIQNVLSLGVERVVIGENIKNDFSFIKEASNKFGSSSITAMINIKKTNDSNYEIFFGKNKFINNNPLDIAKECQQAGAGELIINQIDREGKGMGFDLDLINALSSILTIPIVALGGCGSTIHIKELIDNTNISGIACSSIFVYADNTKNVLLKYNEVKNEIANYFI